MLMSFTAVAPLAQQGAPLPAAQDYALVRYFDLNFTEELWLLL